MISRVFPLAAANVAKGAWGTKATAVAKGESGWRTWLCRAHGGRTWSGCRTRPDTALLPQPCAASTKDVSRAGCRRRTQSADVGFSEFGLSRRSTRRTPKVQIRRPESTRDVHPRYTIRQPANVHVLEPTHQLRDQRVLRPALLFTRPKLRAPQSRIKRVSGARLAEGRRTIRVGQFREKPSQRQIAFRETLIDLSPRDTTRGCRRDVTSGPCLSPNPLSLLRPPGTRCSARMSDAHDPPRPRQLR